ncbi:MAG: putative ATP-dependent helicase [Propionibacteriaceae bacterium]|nr:putative ATP-dependent helicase [Propionibacteriaceae bacterium]
MTYINRKGETLSNESTDAAVPTSDSPENLRSDPATATEAGPTTASDADEATTSAPDEVSNSGADADLATPEPVLQQTFADLGVMPDISEALAEVGIVHPFPIQSMAIPIALVGTDMIGQARTGTGKTLAFGVTLLQRIVAPGDPDYAQMAKPGAPQALVVAPTRELASQVSKDIAIAASRRGARVLTVYGGVGYDTQLDALKEGVDVVVGTPGRLLDIADRGALDLSHIKVLVLDEADEMLDLGFLPDVERILAKTPELRQTMLFSATMPSAIVTMARRHLRHPVNIRAESAQETTTVPATAQFVYQAHDLDKPEVVARILQAENRNRAMIFCRTKRSAQRVSDDLAERGFAAASIHGDLSQILREKALKKFRSGSVDVLVATDVAARGIDVEGVTHVINYECPEDDKTYVHRIGRTGRAGASGIAITFVDWADQTRWKVINNTLGLPFPEPQETYSTSAHLYHDLGIEPGTTGRIAPPKEQPSEAPRERKASAPRPKRERSRRRTHNGVPVDAPAEASAGSEPAAEAAAGEQPSGEGAPVRKRRRRRRTSGSADLAANSSSGQTASGE